MVDNILEKLSEWINISPINEVASDNPNGCFHELKEMIITKMSWNGSSFFKVGELRVISPWLLKEMKVIFELRAFQV